MKKRRKCKSTITALWRAQQHRILIFMGGAADSYVFFIKRVAGDIMSNSVLPHTTLVTEEEHLIYLLMIILIQLLILSSKPCLELLKLLFLNIGRCLELLQLFPHLIFFSRSKSLHLASTTSFFFLIQWASTFAASLFSFVSFSSLLLSEMAFWTTTISLFVWSS